MRSLVPWPCSSLSCTQGSRELGLAAGELAAKGFTNPMKSIGRIGALLRAAGG